MSSTEETKSIQPKNRICGGVSRAQPVEENHLKIWNLYKDSVEKKLREQFQIPEFYPLMPIEVSTQIVAGINYFFKIELPEQRFVTVRITHGKTEGLGEFSIDNDQS